MDPLVSPVALQPIMIRLPSHLPLVSFWLPVVCTLLCLSAVQWRSVVWCYLVIIVSAGPPHYSTRRSDCCTLPNGADQVPLDTNGWTCLPMPLWRLLKEWNSHRQSQVRHTPVMFACMLHRQSTVWLLTHQKMTTHIGQGERRMHYMFRWGLPPGQGVVTHKETKLPLKLDLGLETHRCWDEGVT